MHIALTSMKIKRTPSSMPAIRTLSFSALALLSFAASAAPVLDWYTNIPPDSSGGYDVFGTGALNRKVGVVAVASDGRSYLAVTSNDSGYLRPRLIAVDDGGAVAWEIASSTQGTGAAVAMDPFGDIVFSGQRGSDPALPQQAFLGRYDASGNEMWSTLYSGTSAMGATATRMHVADDGAITLSGTNRVGQTGHHYLAVRYDGTGDLQWSSTHEVNWVYIQPSDLAVGNDGSVVQIGTYDLTNRGLEYLTTRLNVDGAGRWARTYGVFGQLWDIPTAVAIDSGNGVVVTGYAQTWPGAPFEFSTVKYDAAGTQLWARQHSLPGGSAEPHALVIDADDNIYVAGYQSVDSMTNTRDVLIAKYSPTGSLLWSRSYDAGRNDAAHGAALDGDGNLIVVGNTWTGEHTEALLLGYGQDGTLLWADSQPSWRGGGASGQTVVIDDDGGIVVGVADVDKESRNGVALMRWVEPQETVVSLDSGSMSHVGEMRSVQVRVESERRVPRGSVIVDDGTTACDPIVLEDGAGECSFAWPHAGKKTLTATFVPEAASFIASIETAEHTVLAAGTRVAIEPTTPSTSTIGAQVIVDVILTAEAPGAGAPQGGVRVEASGGETCTAQPLDADGRGTCALMLEDVGSTTLVAHYDGSADFLPATSDPVPHDVGKRPTSVTLTTQVATPFGESVLAHATVHGFDGTAGEILVSAMPGGAECSAVLDSSGAGECSMLLGDVGMYTLTAAFTGDARHETSSTQKTHHVERAAVEVNVVGLQQVYDGAPKPVQVSTEPVGLPVIIRYEQAESAPTDAGSYTVHVDVVSPNHEGNASDLLVIDKATAHVQILGIMQTWNGTPRPVTVITTPAELPVSIVYDGLDSVPIAEGSYGVLVHVIAPNHRGEANATLTVRRISVHADGFE